MRNKKLAVIICFRDWGIDRLSVCVQRLAQSSVANQMDIVASDYGSSDAKTILSTVKHAGGRVIRTDCDGPWSRSRALNIGVNGTDAPFVITTDSDMIFTPCAAEKLLTLLKTDRQTVHLIQCRDVSRRVDVSQAAAMVPGDLEENSIFRPRWGMGGCIAFRREDFEQLGGYDERMEVYGGEDVDFAQRLARLGLRLNWVDDQETWIYHIWHPSSREALLASPAQQRALEANSNIVRHDVSWIRNVAHRAEPVASVLIATHNRARFLMDSINSVLAQTVQNIEVVIMDNGSDDETQDILSSIDDSRVRCMRQGHSGVAAARNKLVAAARAPFLVVHDDDDIMLPWRIEAHFQALSPDVAGTYGGWIDFDDATGDVTPVPGREYDASAFMYTGKIMAHGTTMFRADVLKKYKYREFLPAGADFNLIGRLAHAGYTFKHTKHFHILRRIHVMNMTHTTGTHQKNSATRIRRILLRGNSPSSEKTLQASARNLATICCHDTEKLQEKILPYLPDHLTRRSVTIYAASAEVHDQLTKIFNFAEIQYKFGWIDNFSLTFAGFKLSDLVLLRKMKGITFTVGPVLHQNGQNEADADEIILDALPSSGLLKENSIHFISISPETGQAERVEDMNDGGPQTRIWSSGSRLHYVYAQAAHSLEEAISLMVSCDAASALLFLPFQIFDRSPSVTGKQL